MRKTLFNLSKHQTSVKTELMAGTISFFTIVYIIAVNSTILHEAGMPLEAGIIATIFASVAGCLLAAFLGNSPIILVPGMGLNAMFSYTIVQAMGFSWQEALAVVFVASSAFVIIAFTPLATKLATAIPHSLKEAITVGLGLFLTFIGLEKGGLIIRGEHSLIALGHFNDPVVLTTLLTLVVAVFLFFKNVPGSFLITVILGTLFGYAFGIVHLDDLKWEAIDWSSYMSVAGHLSFTGMAKISFWIAAFSLAMVLVFENIGLVHGHSAMGQHPEKFKRALQATALSTWLSGLFGTSPTVATVESAAGISAGGRTGLTSLTTAGLFLLALPAIPLIKLIPSSAIAPILLIIGSLMVKNMTEINFGDYTEGFPAFLIIVMIPFTSSIADGIAFGFVAYLLIKLAFGKRREIPLAMYIISTLFFLNFVLHAIV